MGGDTVSYNGKTYKARWWTTGETPGQAEVWQLV
nr:carbohydrate-binding protein [Paenibacillus sp. A9]